MTQTISDQFSLKTAIDFKSFDMEIGMPSYLSFAKIERTTSSFADIFSNIALETAQNWIESFAVYYNARQTLRDPRIIHHIYVCEFEFDIYEKNSPNRVRDVRIYIKNIFLYQGDFILL